MEKNMYQIQYTDNTYRMVDWTKEEFKQVGRDMENEDKVSILNDGIFSLVHIRAIVFIPPVVEPEIPEGENELDDEWGFVDRETAEWLKIQGIEVGRKSK
jgi:hypothetical protein